MKSQHIFKSIALPAVAASALWLGACASKTSGPDDLGQIVGEWYLSSDESLQPRLEHLTDIASALSAYGLEVGFPEGEAYRLGFRGDGDNLVFEDWIAASDANLAAYLRPVEAVRPGNSGITLFTSAGIGDDSLQVEVAGSKLWLEGLLGSSVLSFAYPTHVHDRRALEAVRDAGYLVARNGQITYEPMGSYLLGSPDDPAWTQGWLRTSPYELPLTIQAGEVQALDPDQVADWLAEADHLPLWKSQHRWIQLYTRTDSEEATSTEILDEIHLEYLVDALLNDGDVWIESMGDVALWALGAGGQSPDADDPLLWRADPSGENPWNGFACAFSFSTDDGFRTNLTHYAPVFTSRNLSYTAFCSPEKIQIGDTGYELYLDSADLLELAGEGIEIGCNGMTRRFLLPPQALVIRDPAEAGYEVEVLIGNGKKILRLWKHD